MRLALIPPDSLMEMMHRTDIHLLLPEQLERLPEAFIRSLKGYRILDNGAAESDLRPINQLLNLIDEFDFDELVLPDVLMGCDQTLQYARSYSGLKATRPYLKLMAVAQGMNFQELMKCITGLTHMEHVDTIGLPRWMLSSFGIQSRVALARSLYEDDNYPKPIHCLGANAKWPGEMFELKGIKNIRSMDTSLPFVYGLKRVWLPSDRVLWREPHYFKSEILTDYQRKAVEDNVRLCIKGTKASARKM
jgi:hypothetical protein